MKRKYTYAPTSTQYSSPYMKPDVCIHHDVRLLDIRNYTCS